MINVFFPYYQCGEEGRQKEINLCLSKNANNRLIDKLFVVIDDGSECLVDSANIQVISIDSRLTYKKWIEMTAEYCDAGVSILCNSDIYFDHSLDAVYEVLTGDKEFLSLSRWELLSGETTKHPNPHWSQDVWGITVGEDFSASFLHQLDFPMGVPRCDNKIAYLFSVQGWRVFNPVDYLKSIHVHETQVRTYDKKLDDRILGGVAYVYPGRALTEEAAVDIDVWTKRTEKVNRVSLNKSMEKWLAETIEKPSEKMIEGKKIDNLELSQADTDEVLRAIKENRVQYSLNTNFQVFETSSCVVFLNNYQLGQVYSLEKSKYEENKALANVVALIPPVIDCFVDQVLLKPRGPDDTNFWQYPAATEKQAYENHIHIKPGQNVDAVEKVVNVYLPLPWATYVDKKSFPEQYLRRISAVISFYKTIASDNGFSLRVHSVCQHIHWVRMLNKAEELGVTDFHLSHKDSKSDEKQARIGTKLKLHGWPLIAVNYETPDRSEGMERKPMNERRLLASFIGAHMPHYRDNSRVQLFEAGETCGRDDVFVDLGDEWHFNKVVYEEQVLNKEIESHHIDEHHRKTFRYNSVLSDSKFSLCPEGAGPNTLRFWESISVGSIPVIFSDDLSVLRDRSLGNSILNEVVVWLDPIDSQLFNFLNKFEKEDLDSRSKKLMSLYDEGVRPLTVIIGNHL